MKKLYTYYSLGLLTAFGLLMTGVQAFDLSGVSITRENMQSRARFEVVCDRVRDERLNSSYICDGRPKPPTPTPATCGNDIIEDGEQCDGSAPEGYTCSSQCNLVEDGAAPICGNGIVESGEQCDGSAPEGHFCSELCVLQEIVEEEDYQLETGKVVINELFVNVDAQHGVDVDDEWIELYNADSKSINLKGWKIEDAYGGYDIIQDNFVLQPGGFVLLAVSDSIIDYWPSLSSTTPLITLNSPIGGDGLSNIGDALLISVEENYIDYLSYGSNQRIFSMPVPQLGQSLERSTKGQDTNSSNDWRINKQPTPGF